jgi:hypothetical protein
VLRQVTFLKIEDARHVISCGECDREPRMPHLRSLRFEVVIVHA